MKKRLLTLTLALAMCLTLVLPAAAESGPDYSDIPEDHWSADSVERATELGLFQGMGEGRFGRGEPISRAAFVTALVRLFDWEEVSPARPSFSDVTPDRWFYDAVETALAHDALATAEHAFRPTDNITREEMASMLVRGLGYTSLAAAVSDYDSPFDDISTNRGFIVIAYDLGIVDGVDEERFNPGGSATREQAAAMLVRVYDLLNEEMEELSELGSYRLVAVTTPEAQEGDELPTTPLEPLTDLYDALLRLKNSDADMSRVALHLVAGGVRTVTGDGSLLGSEPLTAGQVEDVLEHPDVNVYYNDRYQSAYCTYQPNPYQEAVVWYQSEESMAAKLQLAQLFGVNCYILE